MTRSRSSAPTVRTVLWMAMLMVVAGCDDSPTGPESEGAIFEGDWTAWVYGSVMTLRIGEFHVLSSEGQILWDTYVGRLRCSSRDPVLSCSVIGLASPENPDDIGGCIPEGRRFPYVDITAADDSTIRAVVGGELHRDDGTLPCGDDAYLSWEPAVEVEFRRE